ncbi:hypothetical protein JCM11251_003983 [Rhodosporidiobolus azoricus]
MTSESTSHDPLQHLASLISRSTHPLDVREAKVEEILHLAEITTTAASFYTAISAIGRFSLSQAQEIYDFCQAQDVLDRAFGEPGKGLAVTDHDILQPDAPGAAKEHARIGYARPEKRREREEAEKRGGGARNMAPPAKRCKYDEKEDEKPDEDSRTRDVPDTSFSPARHATDPASLPPSAPAPYKIPPETASLSQPPSEWRAILRLHNEAWKDVWGRKNLRYTDGLPHLAAHVLPFFALLEHEVRTDPDPVFVREEYLEVSKMVQEQDDGQADQRWTGFFYVGTPGVGKSTFLIFHSLLRAENRQHFLLSTSKTPEVAYLWTDEGVLAVQLCEQWHQDYVFVSHPTRLHVLIDSAPTVVKPVSEHLVAISNATEIIASSPRSELYKLGRKLPGTSFCVAKTWQEEEVRVFYHLSKKHSESSLSSTPYSLSTLFRNFRLGRLSTNLVLPPPARDLLPSAILPRHRRRGVAVYGVLELFAVYGGVIRQVSQLQITKGPAKKPFHDLPLFSICLDLLKTPAELRRVFLGKEIGSSGQLEGYHRVVHLQPASEFCRATHGMPVFRSKSPTKYVRAIVMAALKTLQRAAREELAQTVMSLSSLKGFFFDILALHHFVVAPPDVTEIVLLSPDDPPLVYRPPQLAPLECDPCKEGTSLPDEPSLLILPPLFPGLDGIIYTSSTDDIILLQITTSETHDLKEEGFEAIFSAFPSLARSRNIYVAFVTPSAETGKALTSTTYTNLRGGVEIAEEVTTQGGRSTLLFDATLSAAAD